MSKVFSLETARDQLKFDATSGRLISLKCKNRPRRELVVSHPEDPAFVLQYFSPMREYQMLSSHDAETTTISVSDVRGRRRLVMDFGKIGGLDVHVRAEVEAAADWESSYWRIAVNNRAGLEIVDVQFPIVVARCPMTGEPGTGTVVLPQYMGPVSYTHL
ncbi:MAG: hypothetical protein N2512_03625, partial [Armatimonadetes bacterium]|nr:hypothetical protein [Armatimonadota bacterium]